MCSDSPPPAPTSQTVTNTTIPDYAKPYVESMLGKGFGTVNPATGVMEGGVFNQPYQAYTGERQAGFTDLQNQAQTGAANLALPGTFGRAEDLAGQAGIGALGTTGQASAFGAQGAAAGQAYGQNATDPSAIAAYMNPYIKATLDPALQLQQQQFGQQNAANQAQATQAGAFGGGRQAVLQGLNQQSQALAQNQLVGNAYNQAFNTANQNMQTAGSQAMQGAQIGLQGVGAQQAGFNQAGSQAANLANIGNQGLGAQQGILNTQAGFGATQQAQNQAGLTQQYNDFLAQRNFQRTQLADQSNILRGVPLSGSQSSDTFAAAPSSLNQLVGAGTAAFGASRLAKGGKTKEKKRPAGLAALALMKMQ